MSQILREIERVVLTNDEAAYRSLLLSGANTSNSFLDEWVEPGNTRVVVQQRLIVETEGLPSGSAYDIYADAMAESGRVAIVGTLLLRIARDTERPGQWRLAGLNVLTTVRGLFRLSINVDKQFDVTNFALHAEDFSVQLPQGVAFVAESAAGMTGIVLLGRGEIVFSPALASEKGQVKIYSGAEEHRSRFSRLYVRANPADFDNFIDASALRQRPVVDPGDLRRAEEVFQENIALSYSLDLADLSRETWSVLPKFGDIVAEVMTDRAHLTYMHSATDPEDIRFFDRTRERTISIYPSKARLASQGPFFDEDDGTEYDIVNYEIDASFDPRREWIDAKATLLVSARTVPVSTLVLKLAAPLAIRSVVSRRLGYLMALRVSGQDDVVINLPQPVAPNELLDLEVTYGGRLPAVAPEREVLDLGQGSDYFSIQAMPSYIYTGRSRWYPQGQVTDYATATLLLRVPDGYSTVASGALEDGFPRVLPGDGRSIVWKEYRFNATQPARYLGWATSRFVSVDRTTVSIKPEDWKGTGSLPPMVGASYNAADLMVESSGLLQRRSRDLSAETERVLSFYGSLLGDIPYQSFTLAVVERDTPGGHSPPYFAALSQPPPATPIAWRTDPSFFDTFPEFFLAHETAHQWWGQAVGWKNYHEQWLSEGFAQYFAALYAERYKRDGTFGQIVRQMSRWTLSRSDQGPVYLGYRLGHIRNDSRVFRALVYNKGALSLHMLRRLIGDDAFFRGLRRFYTTWRFRKAGTEDLKAAFQAEAGRTLGRFFDRWIYGSSLPRLKFTYTTEPNAVIARFEQVGEVFDVPVTVTVQYANNTSMDVVVPVTEQVTTQRIPTSGLIRGIEPNRDGAAPVVFVK